MTSRADLPGSDVATDFPTEVRTCREHGECWFVLYDRGPSCVPCNRERARWDRRRQAQKGRSCVDCGRSGLNLVSRGRCRMCDVATMTNLRCQHCGEVGRRMATRITCHRCAARRGGSIARERRRRKETCGRVCQFCGVDDRCASFPMLRCCGTCQRRGARNGHCGSCGRPSYRSKPCVCEDEGVTDEG